MATRANLFWRAPRRLSAWWRHQSPARQDRLATLAPLVAVLLFMAAMLAAFWYLRNEEYQRTQDQVQRDAELAQQQMRLHLIEDQAQLARIARDLATHAIGHPEFLVQAQAFVRESADAVSLQWVDAAGRVVASHTSAAFRYDTPDGDAASGLPFAEKRSPAWQTFDAAARLHRPAYSAPFRNGLGQAVYQLQVPLIARTSLAGMLVAEFSLEALLRTQVPAEVLRRQNLALSNADGSLTVTASTSNPPARGAGDRVEATLPMTPIEDVTLTTQGWRDTNRLTGNVLVWVIGGLAGLTLWMLVGAWRHLRRRAQIQSALMRESNFRRAMENSMLTGMRAMDKEGRLTYVNPAFCAMTGFTAEELVGRLPPYPHWPPDRHEEHMRLLQQELAGRTPKGGIEVKVMRKDRSEFDSRMYVSPLIDVHGVQTGWMTSMTNITEAKRIRDQLSASHERFMTVLEGLDAAVSVVSAHTGEPLFANRSFRMWFGAQGNGHALLAGTRDFPAAGAVAPPVEVADAVDDLGGLPAADLPDAGGEMREVFVDNLQRWFDVRSRFLQWTDGRLAQMIIATDVTARRRAEEAAAQQAERAQVTSRLVTMGEMASTVAHELNQPLTAISNYCNGIISRVRGGGMGDDDLITALQKTSNQAQRAGQIIHRIRNFVRRSEPQRQRVDVRTIVEETVELAVFELRRRNVILRTHVAEPAPFVTADPILIEQVLLNLIRNAAEAIDQAHCPPTRRQVELRIAQRERADGGPLGAQVEFSVADTGPGLAPEALARLYEAFFTTKAEGLGIGLNLCRSIVESHQGRIHAENLYNGTAVVGCRFMFALPAAAPEAAPEDEVSLEQTAPDADEHLQ